MKSKNRYLQKLSTRQGSWPPPSPHSVILTSSVGKIDMWVTPNLRRSSIIFSFPVTRPTVPFFQKTRTFLSRAVGKIIGNQIIRIHFFAGMWFWHMAYQKWRWRTNMTWTLCFLNGFFYFYKHKVMQTHSRALTLGETRGYGALI